MSVIEADQAITNMVIPISPVADGGDFASELCPKHLKRWLEEPP